MDGEANKAFVQRGLCVPDESGGAGEQGHSWGGHSFLAYLVLRVQGGLAGQQGQAYQAGP